MRAVRLGDAFRRAARGITPRWVAVAFAASLAGCATMPDPAEKLDASDLAIVARSTLETLEKNPVGQGSNWTNPATGHVGTVTPIRTFKSRAGADCRELQQTATVDGQTVFALDTACRGADGGWASVRFGSLSGAIRRGETLEQARMRRQLYAYDDPFCQWPYRSPFCRPFGYYHPYYRYYPYPYYPYWR